jgi:Tfp pilus assembly protein PilN
MRKLRDFCLFRCIISIVITKLNLASYPFRNRTTPYLLSALFLFVALIGTILCLFQLNANTKENEKVIAEIRDSEQEITRLMQLGEQVQQQLTPSQQQLLLASHKLVASKRFGWSRLFADLESVLPGGVSASRISVQNVVNEGDVVRADLEFSVISRDYRSVMEMISRMGNSGVFQAELRGQNLQSTQRMTYSEYTLRLLYTPAYGYSTTGPTDIAKND